MALSMDSSLDSLDLSSGLLIEFSENGTDEIGSGDYGDYEEPCFQHENADFNRIFLPTIYSIIFLMGIIGNGLVIIVMGYQKKQRSMTDKYRLHLSVADLLFVITLPFWSVDAAISWYFGNVLCKAVHVIYTVNLYSSVLILAFISLDRYLAIVHATNSQRPRKLLAEKVVYVGVWLPALLLTVPDIIFADLFQIPAYLGRTRLAWSNNSDLLLYYHIQAVTLQRPPEAQSLEDHGYPHPCFLCLLAAILYWHQHRHLHAAGSHQAPLQLGDHSA